MFWKRATSDESGAASSASESFIPECRTWDQTKSICGTLAGEAVLLDTGVIVALLDRSERLHQACAEAVQEIEAPLITCEAVIAESCYLLRNLAGASEAVVENVAAGIFQIPFKLSNEAAGVKQVLRKYRDQRIDLADACLIHLADELGTGDILTLDGDFGVYRWGRNKPFRILPNA